MTIGCQSIHQTIPARNAGEDLALDLAEVCRETFEHALPRTLYFSFLYFAAIILKIPEFQVRVTSRHEVLLILFEG